MLNDRGEVYVASLVVMCLSLTAIISVNSSDQFIPEHVTNEVYAGSLILFLGHFRRPHDHIFNGSQYLQTRT